jgi:hypothetical protein
MEVDISCSLLRIALLVQLEFWLKDPNGNLPAIDRTLLFSDAEDVWTPSTAIGNGVPAWVFAELFYRDLVCMESPGTVLVVVLYIDWVISRE